MAPTTPSAFASSTGCAAGSKAGWRLSCHAIRIIITKYGDDNPPDFGIRITKLGWFPGCIEADARKSLFIAIQYFAALLDTKF